MEIDGAFFPRYKDRGIGDARRPPHWRGKQSLLLSTEGREKSVLLWRRSFVQVVWRAWNFRAVWAARGAVC